MSSKPVALMGDLHTCPAVAPGPTPHVGGPVVSPGQATVRVNGRPVAVVSGSCLCTGPGLTDQMTQGSAHVRIDGKAVMRQGDATAHGGRIITGMPSVLVG